MSELEESIERILQKDDQAAGVAEAAESGPAPAHDGDATEAAQEPPADGDKADEEPAPRPSYTVRGAPAISCAIIYKLLLEAHAAAATNLPPVDAPTSLHAIVELAKLGVLYVLVHEREDGSRKIVGTFAWGAATYWFADPDRYKDFHDLFWYVTPEHRGTGSVDLLRYAVEDARGRFKPFNIRIDSIGAQVDKDLLDRLMRAIGFRQDGATYRPA